MIEEVPITSIIQEKLGDLQVIIIYVLMYQNLDLMAL